MKSIDPFGEGLSTVPVFCDDNGWTVFQSRGQFNNSPAYFFRGMAPYRNGFGIAGLFVPTTVQ